LEIVVAATAEKEQVAAGFGAVLVVTALGIGGALETSEILVLKPVRGEGDTLAFLLPFLLVTRVKTTSLASGVSTSISTSEKGVEIGLGPYTVLIASTRVGVLV